MNNLDLVSINQIAYDFGERILENISNFETKSLLQQITLKEYLFKFFNNLYYSQNKYELLKNMSLLPYNPWKVVNHVPKNSPLIRNVPKQLAETGWMNMMDNSINEEVQREYYDQIKKKKYINEETQNLEQLQDEFNNKHKYSIEIKLDEKRNYCLIFDMFLIDYLVDQCIEQFLELSGNKLTFLTRIVIYHMLIKVLNYYKLDVLHEICLEEEIDIYPLEFNIQCQQFYMVLEQTFFKQKV